MKKIKVFTLAPRFSVTLRSKRGFTLIELLVVISIIAFLATLAITALDKVRAQARDATRKSDLRQLAKALELYYDDNNLYPTTGASNPWWGNCIGRGSYDISGPTGWIPYLAPAYLAKLPIDPKTTLLQDTSNCYIYRSDDSRKEYKILAAYTVETVCLSATVKDDPMCDPHTGRPRSFSVWTEGAKMW